MLHRQHHHCYRPRIPRSQVQNEQCVCGGVQFWHRRLPERSAYWLILKRSTVGVCLPHVYIYIFTHIHPHAHTRRLVKVSVTWIHSNVFLVHMRLYFHDRKTNRKLTKKKQKKQGWIHLSLDDASHFFLFFLSPLHWVCFIKASIKTTMLCHPLHE